MPRRYPPELAENRSRPYAPAIPQLTGGAPCRGLPVERANYHGLLVRGYLVDRGDVDRMVATVRGDTDVAAEDFGPRRSPCPSPQPLGPPVPGVHSLQIVQIVLVGEGVGHGPLNQAEASRPRPGASAARAELVARATGVVRELVPMVVSCARLALEGVRLRWPDKAG